MHNPEQEVSSNHYPIVIMSFNRPSYLQKVLDSLKNQTIKTPEINIHLFQDGAQNKFDGTTIDVEPMNECIKLFKDFFPDGNVHNSFLNLGVALNFDRAENYIFNEVGADCAFFFEDDMELMPNYVEALISLSSYALSEPKVSYIAAYGNHVASLIEQHSNASRLEPLEHKWGFSLTRRQWLAQRHLIEPYLDIIRSAEYSKRDHIRIKQYFNSLGYDSPGTSQDAAKDIAGLVLGVAKLNTVICLGRYIGETGQHFNRKAFVDGGYDRTITFDGDIPKFSFPTASRLDEIISNSRKKYKFDPPRASSQLAQDGSSNVDRDLSIKPQMSDLEIEMFVKFVGKSEKYLEFGAGGSTLLAAVSGAQSIISVDSDANWLEKVKSSREATGIPLEIVLADIGPVGDWGVPLGTADAIKWPSYYLSVWNDLKTPPDVVMVDGRFRVACALQALIRMEKDGIVLFHDFWNRPHYHTILPFCDVLDRVDTLAVLKLSELADFRKMALLISRYAVDYN